MADETRSRPTQQATPGRQEGPPARPPGWKVTPAPDGRGRGPADSKPPSGPNPRWIVVALVVGLLALNLWISSQALSPNARVRIPYFPTFITQVKDNNVSSINSTNSSIQGTFRHKIRYPAD